MANDNWGGLMGGVGSIIGAGMGMLNQGAQDDRQVRQQKKLNELQVQSQKEMADYGNQKQEELANKLNAKWQVEQLKKAGLSVGLMYGKGGPGGATTGSPSGGGASGASAANAAQTEMSATAAPQMGLMMAQIANTLADTAKKNAEKPNIEADTVGKGIDNEVKEATKYDAMSVVEQTATKLMHEANIAGTNQVIKENTSQAEQNRIIAESVGAGLENDLTAGKIKLTAAQIKQIKEQIAQGWKGLEFQGTDKVTGKYIEELIQAVKKMF